MTIKLDKKDWKILYELDVNARQTNSAIAKKVGLSKYSVAYRIKQLEQNGVIERYYAIIDFYKLGYLSLRIYLKLSNASLEVEDQIMDFLNKNDKVTYSAKVKGVFDINFGTIVRNIYEFEKFYSEFKNFFNRYIEKEKVSLFTKVHHFSRAYFLNKKQSTEETRHYGSEEIIPIDEKDLHILKLLAQNSRITVVDLSRKLKIAERTIVYRIRNLERKKIIQGYRALFNLKLLGYTVYRLDLSLNNLSNISTFIQFAHHHPNITYFSQGIGCSDVELEIEVKDENAFEDLLEEVRQKFPEIRSYSYFTFKKYYKEIYFP
jgi:DNA-binding Lrp family transcriptional regulator